MLKAATKQPRSKLELIKGDEIYAFCQCQIDIKTEL